jgi:hypothetical protein
MRIDVPTIASRVTPTPKASWDPTLAGINKAIRSPTITIRSDPRSSLNHFVCISIGKALRIADTHRADADGINLGEAALLRIVVTVDGIIESGGVTAIVAGESSVGRPGALGIQRVTEPLAVASGLKTQACFEGDMTPRSVEVPNANFILFSRFFALGP